MPGRTSVVVHAKPKGGKAKGKSALAGLLEKKAQAEAQSIASPDQYRDPEIRALLLFVCSSYFKHMKKPLIEAEFETLPDALFNAPFVLLAHDAFKEGVTEPRFVYANRAALELWEARWDTLVGLPSRQSAPDAKQVQQDREATLDAASTRGVVSGYSGDRQSTKGKKFKILDATLFNIEDATGEVIGQAATFDRYEVGGKEHAVQGYADAMAEAVAAAAAVAPPSQEDVDAAQAAVVQWAEYVRALKEGQGLGNKDPQVQEAVGNLKAWKARLEDLQKRLADALAAAEAAFDDDDDDAQP